MSGKVSCSEQRVITDGVLIDKLWSVYVEAFADASKECIQEQLCYGRREFDVAMSDADLAKFVAIRDGEPVGLMVCTKNLEKARIAYVNPERLRLQFPEYADRIYYYTIIAVKPDAQGGRIAAKLIEPAARLMESEGALSAFDFSQEKNPHLPDLICAVTELAQKKLGLTTQHARYYPLGGQNYGVVKMTKD